MRVPVVAALRARERPDSKSNESASASRYGSAGFGDERIEDAGNNPADEGRHPKKPKLMNGPPTYKDRRSSAPRRIHGGVRHRNADEMNERQSEADGKPRES